MKVPGSLGPGTFAHVAAARHHGRSKRWTAKATLSACLPVRLRLCVLPLSRLIFSLHQIGAQRGGLTSRSIRFRRCAGRFVLWRLAHHGGSSMIA
jgi:hypothetical protein